MNKEKITPEPIMKIMQGAWSFRVLVASVELEIYTKIAKGLDTGKKIADELKTKEDKVERLLNACVALNLLTKNKDTYSNTPETNQFLDKGKQTYYGDMMIMFGKRDSLKNLKEAVLTDSENVALAERMENKEDARIFTKAMHNNAVGPAMILSKKFDFSNYKKILDLGGGSGAFSITLTKNNPNLKAVVFDLPNVCEVAREYIKKAGADRVETIEGNFFEDKFPENCDMFLLSQILHSFDVEKNKVLLKKVYDSLPEEGIIIINEFLLNKDKTGPLYSSLFALNMLINSENGNAYTEDEIKNWLEDTGFKYLETIKLSGPVTSIIGKK